MAGTGGQRNQRNLEDAQGERRRGVACYGDPGFPFMWPCTASTVQKLIESRSSNDMKLTSDLKGKLTLCILVISA